MSSAALTTKSSPATEREAATFFLGLALNNVHLPVRHDSTHCGTIVDATGEMILVVDMNRERPDHQVMAIAELIVVAVNAHGGFQADAQ